MLGTDRGAVERGVPARGRVSVVSPAWGDGLLGEGHRGDGLVLLGHMRGDGLVLMLLGHEDQSGL